MTEFTASNGYTILARKNATVDWWSADEKQRGIIQVFTHSQVWQALREFFQHERDEELGRWRHPEDPRYVVYGGYSPGEERRFARVVQEQMGIVSIVYEGKDHQSEVHDIAVAYFEGHPERKPWLEADAGDIWVISAEGEEQFAVHAIAGLFGSVQFVTVGGKPVNMSNSTFTGFRKIWPEEAAS